MVTVKLEGPAELIGIDNGYPACHSSFKADTMAAHNGKLLVMLRTKQESGSAKLCIMSEGLVPATLEFKIVR